MSLSANPSETPELKPSHIVGIGASAGGLSALEQFFANMPVDTGMAFVVIQHLSPDFKSLMDDLLSRHTSMQIHRVSNGIELQPNSIYLIPPKTHMTVREEKLYLTERTLSPHVELPIDIFFNSLAEDAGERAVGVVLSGTGSDGSRGIVSINKNGGLVIVQSPESAQFDGMPRSAIATGVADFILGSDRIPRILVEYAISPLAVRTRMHHELEVFEDEGEFAGIFALLRRGYNLDFSKYKGSTVGRRIRRRMEFRQIPEVADYAAIVSGDQGELELLYKDLLIGVTEFFRDKQAFEFLEHEVIPRLFTNLNKGEDLRVWSAACATGEEAYSIAILLFEKAEEIGFMGKITVFATDVHKTSLDFASQGLYDRARLTNVNPGRMDKFFKKEGGDLFRVTSELRKLVVFAPHNLLNDPPFTRLDLVCCRNLLIYFQTEVQERVISLFHFALKIDGILFLGGSEGLGPFVGEFEVIANQHKMFRKIRDLKLALNLDANRMDRRAPHLPVAVFQQGSSRAVTIDRQVLSDYDTLLRRHMPPGVLINESRQIIHYFGNVAEYLKMPQGRAENSILALAEDNLHIALSTSLQRADTTRQLVVTRNVRIRRGEGEFLIDLNVSPLPDEKSHITHYHVYFERVRPTEPPLSAELSEDAEVVNFDVDNHFRQHVADLEMELQSTRESLQTTVEELQTSNEELQATNEELLASNEELQSTNEELHSVNEELYSVNSEFERKNIELKQLNNDHENLLASTDIGTVFLDRQLRIRKYNPAIAAFFKLMPQDIGRPIDHIAYHLSQQEVMLADINRVLSNGIPVEQEEKTRDNTWLLKRIMPFRTETGQVEGVVITFTDITTIKTAELKVLRLNEELEQNVEDRTSELKSEIQVRLQAEESLKEQEKFIRSTIDGLSVNICVIDAQEKIVITNRAWNEFAIENNAVEGTFGEGVNYLDACKIISEDDQADINEFNAGIRAVLTGVMPEFVKEYPCNSPNEERWFMCRANAFSVSGANYAVISHENITDRKRNEIERIRNQERLESLVRVSQHTSQNTQELLDLALEEAITLTRSKFGYIYHYSEDAREFILNTWSNGVMKECSIVDPQTCYGLEKTGLWGEVVRQRTTIMLNDFQADHPLKKGYPEGHAQLHRFLSIPVFYNDKIVAVVAVANKESDYSQTDILQLTLLMDSVWRIIEQSRIEEEKLALEKQYQQTQKLESLGVLAGGIAHDFNNILAIIIGNCNLVRMEYATAEIHIPLIEKAAERAAELCRQMLAYAGKASFTLYNVNLTALVEETVKMLKSAISQNIIINTNFSSDIPTIKSDNSQLRQVVMNLIINASEAIGEEHGAIHVSLNKTEIKVGQSSKDHLGSIITPGWYVCLEVSDTGCGMDYETKQRVFEPFYTTKFTGRGLGMSAVLGIITAHKGALQLTSQPGQGTTFKIYLPILESETVADTPIQRVVTVPWQGSGTILLVEDEEPVMMIAKTMLKALGFAIIEASNGKEALDQFQKHVEDITMVVTDLGMPEMDGYMLFRELKNLKQDLPIVISTGFGDIDVTSRIARDEISGLIGKPFNFDQLRTVLKNVVSD
jgi:two-component system CheB/CheR fusion protein